MTGPVNLGNPGEFTMPELAAKVLALAGSGCPVEHRPLPSDDPARRKPDISRARELLGWEPPSRSTRGSSGPSRTSGAAGQLTRLPAA